MFSKTFRSFSAAKQTAFLAVFIAASVVANSYLNIDVTPSTKITFSYFVCFFAGFLLGPFPGFIVGILGDAIGFLLVPSGVYWLFGLTLGLYGFFAGVFMNLIPGEGKKWLYGKAAITFAVCFVLITCITNSLVNYYYLYIFVWEGVYKKAFWVWLGGRLAFQSVVYVVNMVLCYIVLPFSVRIKAFHNLV